MGSNKKKNTHFPNSPTPQFVGLHSSVLCYQLILTDIANWSMQSGTLSACFISKIPTSHKIDNRTANSLRNSIWVRWKTGRQNRSTESTRAPAERGSRVIVGQEENEVGLVLGSLWSELLKDAIKGRYCSVKHLQRHSSTLQRKATKMRRIVGFADSVFEKGKEWDPYFYV